MFLLLGAFIAGLLTVLAPCVLPLLPIIIGGSLSGNTKDKKRPVVIALSLAVSLVAFTLLLKATTLLINVPPQTFSYISGTIIVALGFITLFPAIYARLIARVGIEKGAQKVLGKGYNDKRSLIGPIIIGAALGPVFSSCSPVYAYILATILPVNFAQALTYIISYVLGLSVVLLLIGFYGQRFVGKVKFASDPKGWFQRIVAILFIIVGLLVFTGYDKQFQVWVSAHTPLNFDAVSSKLLPAAKNKTTDSKLFNVQAYNAPEFSDLQQWINSQPLSLQKLKGKVVLVDFWTYSCINCIRNNPYLEKWYETYKHDGLIVIGVHAPEFAFEKNLANVAKAAKDQHVTYPIGLDNDFATWNAFNNRSWPSSFLIDANGSVRRIHEGEGQYQEEETAIRQLLTENGARLHSTMAVKSPVVTAVSSGQSPETYLGSRRASNYTGSPALSAAPVQTFSRASNLAKNQWSLGGTWEVSSDKIIAHGSSTLAFHVAAKEIYLVGGSSTPQAVSIELDGKPVSSQGDAGIDVHDSMIEFGESRLYRLVSFPKFVDSSTIVLSVPDGVELNVFTFGS